MSKAIKNVAKSLKVSQKVVKEIADHVDKFKHEYVGDLCEYGSVYKKNKKWQWFRSEQNQCFILLNSKYNSYYVECDEYPTNYNWLRFPQFEKLSPIIWCGIGQGFHTTRFSNYIGDDKKDREDYHKQWKEKYKLQREFIDTLINHTPLGKMFLHKNIDDIMEVGFVGLDSRYPHNYITHVMTHIRNTWEFDSWLRNWKYLMDLGIEPTLTFMLLNLFALSDDGEYITDKVINNHEAMNAHLTVDELCEGYKAINNIKPSRSYTVGRRKMGYKVISAPWSNFTPPYKGPIYFLDNIISLDYVKYNDCMFGKAIQSINKVDKALKGDKTHKFYDKEVVNKELLRVAEVIINYERT